MQRISSTDRAAAEAGLWEEDDVLRNYYAY